MAGGVFAAHHGQRPHLNIDRGSIATQLKNEKGNLGDKVIKGITAVVKESLGQATVIMRQEVPIERLYYNYMEPFETTWDSLKGRACCLFGYTLEGAVRVVAECVGLIFIIEFLNLILMSSS